MSIHRIDADASRVWISGTSSVHPIHATATGLEGWFADDMSAGEIRVQVAALRSGNALVDRETRRRIDAKKHPEISGVVTCGRPLGDARCTLQGDLSFRGETVAVEGEVTVVDDGDRLVVEGTQTFDVRDWGLEPPRIALLKVHPRIEVRIHLEAVVQPGDQSSS